MRIRENGRRQEENIGRSFRSHPEMNTFGSAWKESPDGKEKEDGLV
jgi:hypothetical protein